MIHRHLEVPDGTPLEDLPIAALHDLLDRGDLEDWRPILTAIENEPCGVVAERVARLVDRYPMYGTSPLFRAWIERCRNRASGNRAAQCPRMSLAAIRRCFGKTQADVAIRLGITQSDYSKLERRSDLRISTLTATARALGGRLRLLVASPRGNIEVDLGSTRRRAATRKRRAVPRRR